MSTLDISLNIKDNTFLKMALFDKSNSTDTTVALSCMHI